MKSEILLILSRTPGDARGASRDLTRRFAAEYREKAGLCPAEVERLPGGKPVFPDGDAYLSVTHTGSLYAAAFASVPVGVDAEARGEADARVAGRFFDEAERRGDFYEVFTAKEAVSKISGAGISALRSIRVRGDRAFDRENAYALRRVERDGVVLTVAAPGEWEIREVWR